MRNPTFAFLVSLPLFVAPVAAQYGGSINSDVPTASAGIQFKNGAKLSLSYKAILFGEGKWQAILEAKNRHERFNAGAARKPIGSVETNVEITASGRKIPAGKYDMFFTVHEQAGWLLNLKDKNSDADPIRWRMAMSDSKGSNKRFKIALEVGETTGTCAITIAFGAKTVTVPLACGKPGAKKEGRGAK